MATRNIVPRANGEGSLGTSAKHWGNVYADNGTVAGRNIANDGTMLDTHETEITDLQNQVTTLEHAYAGAKAAATVANMTDHNQIYVYVGSESGYTNGNWYYWNGTAWTSGGVYQATALETDKTLTVSGAAADAKVTGSLISVVNDIGKTISKNVISNQYNENRIYINGFINKSINGTTGELASDLPTRAATYNIINVQPFSTIYITISSGYKCELFQYLNGAFVKKISNSTQIKIGNINGVRLLVYKNDTTANISTQEAENAIVAYDNVLKIESVNGGNYFNPLTTETGYLNSDGTLLSSSYVTSFFIDVTNISTIYSTVDVRKIARYNEDLTISNDFTDTNTTAGTPINTNGYKYIRISVASMATARCRLSINANETYPYHNWYKGQKSKINNANVLVFGDSIMYGAGNGGVGVYDILHNAYNCYGNDYAISGATVEKTSDESRSCIVEQIKQYIASPINYFYPDFIILDGASNDMVVGTIGTNNNQVFNYTSYNTFADGLNYTFQLLKDNFPKAAVIYVIPHSTESRTQEQETTFYTMAKEICEKWAIPIADIYGKSGLTARNQTQRNMFTNYNNESSGTHPNEMGYNYFYIPMIVAEMENHLKI